MTIYKRINRIPAGKYGTILADPAWLFKNRSAKGEAKNPNQHYDCMTAAEVAAMPVARIAAPDCACLMWCTSPMLDQQMEVLSAWGFTYKGFVPWAKRSRRDRAWAFGTGYGYRGASELLVFGTRGAPKRLSASERNLIVAPVREHSRKPDEQYVKAEIWPGPRIELFSKTTRPGWDAWGDEAGTWAA